MVMAMTPNISDMMETAMSHHRAGQLEQARIGYLDVLRLDPTHTEAFVLLGLALGQQGQLQEGAKSIMRGLCHDPSDVQGNTLLGDVLSDLNHLEAAYTAYDRATDVAPQAPETHLKKGHILQRLSYPEDALGCFQKAVAQDPNQHGAQFALGNCLRALNRMQEAIQPYQLALVLVPNFPDAFINLGNTLKDLNLLNEALSAHDHALAIQPDNRVPAFNQSLIHLLLGDYATGWTLFETRWEVLLQGERRFFFKPELSPSDSVAGKRILIHTEQGFGDSIQFCRLIASLTAQGAEVILEAPGALVPLLLTLDGPLTVVERGGVLPDFDAWAPLMSLPRILSLQKDQIPASTPYLKVDPAKKRGWSERLGARQNPRIGLTWSGGTIGRNDRNRSLRLEELSGLLRLEAEFHVLQKEIRDTDLDAVGQYPNLHLHQEALVDFSDTAALISEMDLVLSVDTAVAHLAGALGQPVWIWLPFAPDFRWFMDRSDSPWYPTARLYRQTAIGAWGPLLDQVQRDLKEALVSLQPI